MIDLILLDCYRYEIVKDVYLVANHSLKKLEPFTYTGKYKGQTYSFQFVRSKNQIMTFDHKGYIEYSLPYIQIFNTINIFLLKASI